MASNAVSSSEILLYTGIGSGPYSTMALKNQLVRLYDDRTHRMREVASLSDCWSDPKSVKAVFVGGGSALEMKGCLTADQMAQVNKIIHQHQISYYGECAGGIFGCERFDGCDPFETYVELPIDEKASIHPLGLFPGVSIGPLFTFPKAGKLTVNDFKIRNIQILQPNSGVKTIPCVHILSPAYQDVKYIEGASILAKHEKLPTLSWGGFNIDPSPFCESLFYQKPNGGPKVVCTSSHLACDSASVRTERFKGAFRASNSEQEKIAQELAPTDKDRDDAAKSNYKMLGIACKE